MLRQQLTSVSSLFLLGVITMLLYDVVIASRDIKGKKAAAKIIEDFIFWQMCAGAVFYTIYTLNEGVIRGYEVAAFLFGMILFQAAVGRKLTKGLKKLFVRCRIKIHIQFDRLNR